MISWLTIAGLTGHSAANAALCSRRPRVIPYETTESIHGLLLLHPLGLHYACGFRWSCENAPPPENRDPESHNCIIIHWRSPGSFSCEIRAPYRYWDPLPSKWPILARSGSSVRMRTPKNGDPGCSFPQGMGTRVPITV